MNVLSIISHYSKNSDIREICEICKHNSRTCAKGIIERAIDSPLLTYWLFAA